MPLRAFIIPIIAGGAMGLPLFAFGHGSEFLDAKFYLDDSGRANLEITADYGGNPMIANEQEARTVLADAVRIFIGSKDHKLADLAPLKLEPGNQLDPDSPTPRGGEDPKVPHQLLTAIWQWRPATESISFSIPAASSQTVLFWMREPNVSPPRWSMLLPGDRTPAIPVPPPPHRLALWGWLAMPLPFLALWWWRRRLAATADTTGHA